MANYKLTQTGAKVQADLDLTEHIQDEFSSSSTYAVGALVIYNTKIYRCHTAVSSAGAWTGSTNWTEQKLSDLLNLKQNTLTFDNAPTSASTNPVTSGGVYTALSNKQDSNTVLTSVASQSSGTGLLKLTNGAASLDTNSYLTSHLYRPIKVDGVQKLADNVNTALDLVAGTNITLSESDGAVTINASGGGSYDLATTQDINRLFETEYTITTSVTNGTYTGDTSIWTSETATVNIAASSGYELPSSVTVTGATSSYSNGVVSLSNPTANVTITATCQSSVSGYEVTFTASGGWTNASEGSVKIYDGQDNTGTLLLNQTPANMNAFPMILQVSSGYCAVYFDGPGVMGIGSSSSQDFNIINGNPLIIGPINKNGSVDLTVYDFDD